MKKPVDLLQVGRLLNPGPVAIVSVAYRDRYNIMPVAWVTPAGFAPPMVAMAISPLRYTHDLVRRSNEFALNIPGRSLLNQVQRLGQISGHQVENKLKVVGWNQLDPEVIRTPLIAECLAHIECVLVTMVEVGDHTLFIGEVQAAQAEEAAFRGKWLLPAEAEELCPLHFLGETDFGILKPVGRAEGAGESSTPPQET
ncbi:MAG: flavin reductase family protein [Chloroflexi bacterium]|nr:flavin reductase family protein [Chloroflexota bacterium]